MVKILAAPPLQNSAFQNIFGKLSVMIVFRQRKEQVENGCSKTIDLSHSFKLLRALQYKHGTQQQSS